MDNNKVQTAVDSFQQGFNCAQAVLSAFSEDLGLDRTTALRIAGGLGGGIARLQGPCGAVTGAVLALGLKYGATDGQDKQARDKGYAVIREFVRRFEQRNDSIICRDLLGVDLQRSDQQIIVERVNDICPRMVADAAEILESMLNEPV